jgi:hypothetical protein
VRAFEGLTLIKSNLTQAVAFVAIGNSLGKEHNWVLAQARLARSRGHQHRLQSMSSAGSGVHRENVIYE